MLKDADKAIMIYGRKIRLNQDDGTRLYDYVACLHPEGFMPDAQGYFFNHSKIDKILHMGYINEEEKFLKIELLNI